MQTEDGGWEEFGYTTLTCPSLLVALTASEGSLAPSPSVAVARKGNQRLFLKFGPIEAFGGARHLLSLSAEEESLRTCHAMS